MNPAKENKDFRILIVDDIPENIQFLGNILLSESYQVSYARSGKEALSLVVSNEFDLILLDIMMPGMNGFEVCRKLKEKQETREVPVIFLTAKPEKESIVQGFELGAQDYVTKPFSSSELLSRVKTHLALKDQREQLKTLTGSLEKKVAERTRELEIANKQLSTLEKAKSDFLSIISHELRTPLNGIVGLTDHLETSLKTTEYGEYIKYLKEACGRLMKFSEAAELITTLSMEKSKLVFDSLVIRYIIDDIGDEIAGQVKLKDIIYKIDIKPPNLKVIGDADLIRNCIVNIVENSVKYTPAGGTVELKCFMQEGDTIVEILDEGPGFTEETLGRVFELFSSKDALHSEGLGLSLASAKLIMDAHNGNVNISNRTTGGALVQLIFPGNP